ncbi:MAG TPA: bifunctional 2-polyprenyl-6-hydroxyphenol methylase/3-demethylubiquinol 3-O-methyltransferase UbiG [Nitrosomonas nitrosa]|jgi:2-polyprenyl-6-hydroxyphenyl methylase/3-demethylubiquinone-9 3-methyltransferase|uniref:Ubiquinone biosynthesis O-methyltransferase n=1 Tax=Nitrosomonas nitrosa TaxID=52442 RepID=A0A8H9D9N3_9PROT|nr:bifunctional 2-polyprenyl-6-hydroxyphenol methylase/3-demethylubiquinol 3-O-methyltransferase UbiG [Nitrosomonas nitrosa]PTR02218.1 3-demethylubiquinone-9 3-methyltransferase [Nitrosomonas nitrosa]CAE6495668.1 3-demethylubiquinone-9 3-methyltransferase and 2-octaprenyl-6-hydroxy phenol methylase [Nitrosomonas nitrosa]HBZ29648.1 bifunctional 2-polyprenyl-6-hydroxyphenol methylase/3-demethylubiquinol 3-O-methyltransferase UbiG [Nitrosomonas nitrosa]HNP52941.1 bifunctional 2-polyprenyl-6-hydrox
MDNDGINADPMELEKFSQLAHRWWDPNSEFKPLHDINPLRLNYIDQLAGLEGKKVLDVGCGGGILSESMAARGADTTGIDLSDKALKVAKLHLLESGNQVDYRKITVEMLAQELPHHFDIVTCMEMLEHVPDPASVIQACADLTKPGGWVFFSTINRNPKSYLYAIIGAEYILKLLPRGTHEYAKFLKPSELARMARNAGLSDAKIIGMTYNPITKIYALEPDTSVNYIMAFRT